MNLYWCACYRENGTGKARYWFRWWRCALLFSGIVFREWHGVRLWPLMALDIAMGIWDIPWARSRWSAPRKVGV